MADTAVETINGIIEGAGGTPKAKTLVPALVDLGELIGGGGGGGGTIADGSVTTAKLADGAVTEDKVADGAITANKIAAGVIPSGGGGAGVGCYYGTSSTGKSAAAKFVTCEGFELTTGAYILVYFSNGNSSASLTLNVNNTGAKNVMINGCNADTSNPVLFDPIVVPFVYNGSKWVCLVQGMNFFCSTSSGAASQTKYLAENNPVGPIITKRSLLIATFPNGNTYDAGALKFIVDSIESGVTVYNKDGATSASNPFPIAPGSILMFVRDGNHWNYVATLYEPPTE